MSREFTLWDCGPFRGNSARIIYHRDSERVYLEVTATHNGQHTVQSVCLTRLAFADAIRAIGVMS